MAAPPWLSNLSRAFKAHRLGRTGWYLEVNRERLRVVSTELPPRPGEAIQGAGRRAFKLQTPPDPATSAAALAEACALFDAVMAGEWTWPDPEATPAADDPGHLSPAALERLALQLEARLVGEQMGESTWQRTWLPVGGLHDGPRQTAGQRHRQAVRQPPQQGIRSGHCFRCRGARLQDSPERLTHPDPAADRAQPRGPRGQRHGSGCSKGERRQGGRSNTAKHGNVEALFLYSSGWGLLA